MLSRLAALALLAVACGRDPLVFSPRSIPVGYDRAPVVDADARDVDGDGDADVVAATTEDFRYLEWVDGKHVDATAATALGKVAAAEAMHRDGDDYVLRRDGAWVRLEYSGIGSWHETDAPVDADYEPEPALEARADLDGDGVPDRARLDGRRVLVELRRGDAWVDVTAEVGARGLALPVDGTRLRAADLDGDGDVDLLVVGQRLYALWSNGGAVE